jgi:hypothetical protein
MGKWRMEVSDILRGSEKIITLADGRAYKASDLLDTMVKQSIFRTYHGEFADVVRKPWQYTQKKSPIEKFLNSVSEHASFNQEVAEMMTESERVGAVVTYMEAFGVGANEACRLALKTVYDYGGMMTKGDRSVIMRLIMPFWAFQKNANRQFIRNLFSPYGSYRMAVARKAFSYGPEYVTEMLYQGMADTYGMDTSRLSPEQLQWYHRLRTTIDDYYKGKVPPDVKATIRDALRGVRGKYIEDGRFRRMPEEIASELKGLGWTPPGKVKGINDGSFYNAYTPRYDPVYLKRWMQDRTSVGIPVRYSQTVEDYNEAYGDDFRSVAMLVPQTSQESSLQYMASMFGTYYYVLNALWTMKGSPFTEEDDGLSADIIGRKAYGALEPFVNVARLPIISDVMSSFDGTGYPVTLHPFIGEILNGLQLGLVDYKPPRAPHGTPLGVSTYRIPSGFVANAFQYTPMAGLNQTLMNWIPGFEFGKKQTLEEIVLSRDPMAAEAERQSSGAAAMRVVEALSGFKVYTISASKTAKTEEQRSKTEETKLPR